LKLLYERKPEAKREKKLVALSLQNKKQEIKGLEKSVTTALTCVGGGGAGVMCRECGSQRQWAQDYPEGRLPVQGMIG
jgi:hypothetical protein